MGNEIGRRGVLKGLAEIIASQAAPRIIIPKIGYNNLNPDNYEKIGLFGPTRINGIPTAMFYTAADNLFMPAGGGSLQKATIQGVMKNMFTWENLGLMQN